MASHFDTPPTPTHVDELIARMVRIDRQDEEGDVEALAGEARRFVSRRELQQRYDAAEAAYVGTADAGLRDCTSPLGRARTPSRSAWIDSALLGV